jgi:hypothetical protein
MPQKSQNVHKNELYIQLSPITLIVYTINLYPAWITLIVYTINLYPAWITLIVYTINKYNRKDAFLPLVDFSQI